MRFFILIFFICLLPLETRAQPQVKEYIEKSKHVLTFIIDGDLCMEESYVVVDGQLVPDGIWKMYDKNGNNVYLIEHYSMGVLVDKLRIKKRTKK